MQKKFVDMTTELTKAKRRRTTKRNSVMKDILPDCEGIIVNYRTENTIEEASALLQILEDKQKEIKILDDEVANLLEDEEELQKHETEGSKFLLTLRKMQAKLRNFVEKKEPDLDRVGPSQRNVGVKLPKIKIKIFDGEAMEWKSFLESFNATVHERTDIGDIEKFTYLRGFLSGSALQAIDGMPLTNENYHDAKDLLEKRYGNPQLVVSSHMNALIKLDRIINANVKDLRELHN